MYKLFILFSFLGLATKKGFREYFSVVLEVLRPFLVDNIPNDQLPLQVQTFGNKLFQKNVILIFQNTKVVYTYKITFY